MGTEEAANAMVRNISRLAVYRRRVQGSSVESIRSKSRRLRDNLPIPRPLRAAPLRSPHKIPVILSLAQFLSILYSLKPHLAMWDFGR